MSDCWFWQVSCNVQETANKASENVVNTWGRSTLESLDKTLTHLGTFWVSVPTDKVNEHGSVGYFVKEQTAWLAGAILVGSLITSGILIMWHMQGEQVKKRLSGLLRMIIVSATCFTVVDLFISMGDEFSTWTINQVVEGSKGDFARNLLLITEVDPTNTGWFIIILGGLLGILSNIVQMAMMLIRGALLPIVAGIIPLAAAAALTDWGRQWLDKTISWTLSFIMMKPAAAIIYATAIKMVSNQRSLAGLSEEEKVQAQVQDVLHSTPGLGGDPGLNLDEYIRGIGLLVLAALAMPALIRMITPAINGIGASGGGAMALIAGGGAVASGALQVARSGGSSGGSGASGSSGSSGPSGANGASASDGSPGGSGPSGAKGGAGSGGATGAGGSAGASGAAGSAGGSAAAGGGAGAAGGAAAAAGPAAPVVAGAIVATRAVTATAQATQAAGEDAAASGGPTGSSEVPR